MALIKCYECGRNISDTTSACVHCGALVKVSKAKLKEEKKKAKKKKNWWKLGIILGVLFIIVLGIVIAYLLLFKKVQTNEYNASLEQVIIITDYINIREDHNINSSIIGKVYEGEIYTVIDEYDGEYQWLEIETSNGIRGFISGIDEYVRWL